METDQELLIKGLKELGIDASATVAGRFLSYLQELQKWNRAYNLTAIENSRDIVIKHFLDSLLYLKAVPEGHWSICDVGSGAGFPGLPMAIARQDIEVALIEPSRKKTAFLRHMKRLLSLSNIQVLESRIEDVRDSFYDIAVTRALFSIDEIRRRARHVLKENGFFILNKGPKLKEEVGELPPDITCEILSAILPMTQVKRSIVKVLFSRLAP